MYFKPLIGYVFTTLFLNYYIDETSFPPLEERKMHIGVRYDLFEKVSSMSRLYSQASLNIKRRR